MSGPPFDQPAECGGLILFMLVRIIKVLELAFRLISTCRGAVRGRAAMVGADFLLSVLIFLIIAVGAGRGCQEWEGGEWYGDSVGTCDWRVTIALFWYLSLAVKCIRSAMSGTDAGGWPGLDSSRWFLALDTGKIM